MNDIILSSLINLFAACCIKGKVDFAESRIVLDSYLHRHFGIRDTGMWLEMFDNLTELYTMSEDLDIDPVVDNICMGLHGKISSKEETLMVLRLMEFCGVDGLNNTEKDMMRGIAAKLHVDDATLDDFYAFVSEDKESDRCGCGGNVRFRDLGDGVLKTMFIRRLNILVFTFTGHDELLLNDVPVLRGAFQIMQKSGVLKAKNALPLYYSTLSEEFVHDSTSGKGQCISFAARNIDFRFPHTDNGIHNFSFTLKSGTLLAIMGGSGAGKTTLLNLLNGNIVPQSGSITINGHSIREEETQRLIGFVPQDDLLIEELTVKENLWYTARLCFDGMTDQELNERVDKTLHDLGLEATADLKVGSPLNKTISGGQRKRLNIALELIREPAVLFLDEPTSGLSSADTEMVINLLKEQTYRGRLIVVNIHQPSSDVYKLFDRLWLLDKGGYPVYDGNPIDAITYFKQAAGYADADTSMCPTCGNLNPEVVLNIIDEKALDSSGMQSSERKVSPQQWNEIYMNDKAGSTHDNEEPEVSDIPETRQCKPGAVKQLLIFLERNVRTKMTNVQYLMVTSLVAPVLAVICALLTRYAPESGYTLMDNKNFVSYMFMAVIVAAFIGMSSSAEEIIHERTLLKREKFLHLNYYSYILSKIIYSAGVSLIQTLIFVLIGNSIMGLHGMTMTWWGVLFAISLLSNLTGLLLSQCMSSIVAIYITIPILLIPQILLCGVVVDFKDLAPQSRTGNVPAIGNLIPSRWAYEALAVETFAHNGFEDTYFEQNREKYEAMYYQNAFLYELESQTETMRSERDKNGTPNPAHMDVVKKNLGVITKVTGLEPFSGKYDYDDLQTYFKKAKEVLAKRGNSATIKADRILSQQIRQTGRDEQSRLKREYTNSQLKDMVMNAHSTSPIKLCGGHIVPLVAPIYLTPLSRNGGAPFYSSVKVVGDTRVDTLTFNLAVLYLMSLVVSIMLLTDFPGKKLRKK